MKIVMFSINPIFPDMVTGGASKHLYHIARYLGELGHDVEVLCAQAEKSASPFLWSENVGVSPVLPFKLPFPQPYDISGADLALIVERVSKTLQDADRFYIHDGEFLLPDVYADIPTIISFRDNIYPESVLGTFIGKADEIICVSPYSAEVIKHTAGWFYPDLLKRIHQVNNGIDFTQFMKKDHEPLARELGVNPDKEFILLHPHRPEPGKGLPETIMLVNQLIHQHDLTKIKVLIPEWIGSMVSAGESEFYDAMMNLMRDLDVRDHFIFIPWMPIKRMPELYSLSNVTLCLGNIVEAFGNVAYESLACGTPSVVARVGVHRTLMPDDLIDKVHFGDINGAAEKVIAILNKSKFVDEACIRALKATMDFDHQVESYAEIITSCRKREQLRFSRHEYDEGQRYCLAPWCYLDGERLYHDYHRTFTTADELSKLLKEKAEINRKDAEQAGITAVCWQNWVDQTWIVPV